MSPNHVELVFEVLNRSVFSALPEDELRTLASRVRLSSLPAGQLIYDPEVSVVRGGQLRAFIADETGRQITVAYLRPGDSVALAHLAGRSYPTAFQAVTDSSLLVIGNDRTLRLQRNHRMLGWRIAQEFATRMNELEAEIARIGFGALRQRLAYHLLAMTTDGHEPIRLIRLTTAVGSPREVVSRTLNTLVADGTIRLDSSGVRIADRDRLQAHARLQ